MHDGAGFEDVLRRLSVAHRILAMEGHNDLTLGHMSIRDPDGRGLWLKKAERGLDEIFEPDDFALIDFEGRELVNPGRRHSEWPIHTEIMKSRPDVNVVGHTHARYSVLFSATDEDLHAFNHEGANLKGSFTRFVESSGLINTVPLGRSLAEALADSPLVLMKNHGITFVGPTIEEATLFGVFMERACRSHIEMAASGLRVSTPVTEAYDRKMTGGNSSTNYHCVFFDYLARTLARSEQTRGV